MPMWCLIHWNLLTHMNLNTGTLLVSHTAGWGMPIYINRILFLVMSLLWFCSTTKPTVSPPANNSNEIATHTRFADRIVEFGEWNLIYFSLKIPSSIHHWIAFFFFLSSYNSMQSIYKRHASWQNCRQQYSRIWRWIPAHGCPIRY